ncbi:MAG: four helix bundle protein [Fibrobacteria bacterium]
MKSLNPKQDAQQVTKGRPLDLSERLLDFAVETIKATYLFPKSQVSSHIVGQVVRSVSSVGANYEEACTAQSRADFIHKMQIALKEIRETVYWIKLATRLELAEKDGWKRIVQEGNELLLILAKSVATSKGVAK